MSIKGRLRIEGFDVDLSEETQIALNFVAADVREPGKVKADHSYTITVPGTDQNHITFNHLFDTNIAIQSLPANQFTPDFNPLKRAEAVYDVLTVQQFIGYAQLKKVNNLNNLIVGYELVLFGEANDFFTENDDKDLSTLDLSAYDHAYTKLNQANSWATSIKKNGVDYYFDWEGYVYPMIDYGFGTDEKTFKVEWMFPAVYVKTIWDKIFEESDFTYDSDFITGELFKHFIIPFHSDSFKLNDAQVEERLFRATNTVTDEYLITPGGFTGPVTTIVFDNDSTAGNFDNGGNYNNANGKYTTNDKSTWNFKARLVVGFRFEPPLDNVDLNTGLLVDVRIHTSASASPLAMKSVYIAQYNQQVDIGDIITQTIDLQVSNHQTWNLDDIYVTIRYIRDRPGNTNFQSGTDGDIYLRVESGSFFYNEVVNDGLKEGETVSLSNVLPDWTCSEFIIAICKAFNLVVQPDRANTKTLIIEPFDDFYNGDILHWSDKVDRSIDIVSELVPYTSASRLLYTYKPDSDYWNQVYTKEHDRIFGDRTIETPTDFGSIERKYELAFSPTPMVGSKVHDRVIPHIYKIDDQGQVSRKAVNPRILYYAGMVATDQPWIHQSNSDGDTSYDSFPYAGTLNDVSAPTFDLNFGQPNQLFYTSARITNQTLYNRFHKYFVDEITDKDSRVVTIWIRLTPVDILELSFRNLIQIDGTLYRLNKIVGYDAASDEPTQVELFKIKARLAVAEETVTVVGGTGARIAESEDDPNGENVPTYYERQQPNGNYYNPRRGQYVTGSNNYVDDESQSVYVSGNNNRVLNGSSGLIVEGDDNVVMGGDNGSQTGNYYDVTLYQTELITTLHAPSNSDGRRCFAQLEAAKWKNAKSCEVIFKGQAAGATAGIQIKIGNDTTSGGDVIIGFPSATQGNATTNPGTGTIYDFAFRLHFTRQDDFSQLVDATARINGLSGDDRFGTPYGRSFYLGEDLTADDILIFLAALPATAGAGDSVFVDSIEVIYNP